MSGSYVRTDIPRLGSKFAVRRIWLLGPRQNGERGSMRAEAKHLRLKSSNSVEPVYHPKSSRLTLQGTIMYTVTSTMYPHHERVRLVLFLTLGGGYKAPDQNISPICDLDPMVKQSIRGMCTQLTNARIG